MQIKDSITLDASGLSLTKDGYLVGDAKVSRAGNVQQYLGAELGLSGSDANKMFGVYRDPDVVFDQESMMSLAGRPVTRNHPSELVTSDNWKELTVGQVGGVIKRDGEHVVAPMAIMDSSAVKEVLNGARSLSAGYTVEIVAADGVADDGTPYQFKQSGKLRFNHVAYLPNNNPRAGNTRIGDSVDSETGGTPNNQGGRMADLKTIVLGDAAVQVAVADAQAIEAFKAATTKQLADAKALADAKDEQIGQLKAELVKAQDAAKIDVDALVAARTELVAQVKAVDAAIDVTGKTDAQLRKEAVAKKMGDAAIVGVSDAEISGMFKVLAATGAQTNPVQAALKSGVVPMGDAAAQADAAWKKSTDFNAWRNQ